MPTRPSIFLVDMTYDTIVISIEYFPIAIGYIAGYLEKKLPGRFDVSLHKFPGQVEAALTKAAPDILALSYWPWNSHLTLAAVRHYRSLRPDGLVILGGANFPMDDSKRQEEFLRLHQDVDICVHHDGEMGMHAVLECYLACGGDKKSMLSTPIAGCSVLGHGNGPLLLGSYLPRPTCLDEIPSPYLTGLMDPFFDNIHCTPLVQHTRGCPFTCAYCWAGNRRNRNIRQFSVERVCAELDYICQRRRHSPNTNFAFADSNFGMYPSDERIAEKVVSMQAEHNFPGYFYTPCGKNNRTRVMNIISRLRNADAIVSLQSTDKTILENIRRENMSVPECQDLVAALHEQHIAVQTEIITALPGETRQTHLNTIRDLINIGFDEIHPFTLMLLEGTSLITPEAENAHAWDKRYRILPRNFGKYQGEIVFETETIVAGSSTFTFDDFMYTRNLHSVLRIVFNHVVYIEYLQYLRARAVNLFDFVLFFHQRVQQSSSAVGHFFAEIFKEMTDELWQDEKELHDFFMQEKNYSLLVSGDVGENLLGKVKAQSMAEVFPQMTHFYAEAIGDYLRNQGTDNAFQVEVDDICSHIMAKCADLWTEGDAARCRSVTLQHDVAQWARTGFDRPLHEYAHAPALIQYAMTPQGCGIRQEVLAQATGSSGSLWKIVGSRIFLPVLFRLPGQAGGSAAPENTSTKLPRSQRRNQAKPQ